MIHHPHRPQPLSKDDQADSSTSPIKSLHGVSPRAKVANQASQHPGPSPQALRLSTPLILTAHSNPEEVVQYYTWNPDHTRIYNRQAPATSTGQSTGAPQWQQEPWSPCHPTSASSSTLPRLHPWPLCRVWNWCTSPSSRTRHCASSSSPLDYLLRWIY